MRAVIARCSVDYSGRLNAHLAPAVRLILVKADGSVLVHADGGSYKPLNWMSPPCKLTEGPASSAESADGVTCVWTVRHNKSEDTLTIRIHELIAEMSHDLGVDPGLVKDGVEAHLQELLADQIELLGPGHRLVRREYPTAIGPVDIVARDPSGGMVVVEVKRRGEIDGVEQLTRYLDILRRDPMLGQLTGVFAAQEIKPQAKVLAESRGIRTLNLDYAAMRGAEDPTARLF
ncbi:MAG: endonuclease NucS [Bifidobacteriaceae bacterium]|nr:endonuclease NucS [Bifidobacteriaceae bacterium]